MTSSAPEDIIKDRISVIELAGCVQEIESGTESIKDQARLTWREVKKVDCHYSGFHRSECSSKLDQ